MKDCAIVFDASMPGEPAVFPPIPVPKPPDPSVPDIPDNDIPVEDPSDPSGYPPIGPDITDPPLTPSDRPYQV